MQWQINTTSRAVWMRQQGSALTVVGWRLLLLLPASDAAAIGGPVVVVLLLVFNEDLPHQLLWRRKRLSGFELKSNKRHKRLTQWMAAFWYQEEKKKWRVLTKLKWHAGWEDRWLNWSFLIITDNYPVQMYWTTLILNRHYVLKRNSCYKHKILCASLIPM